MQLAPLLILFAFLALSHSFPALSDEEEYRPVSFSFNKRGRELLGKRSLRVLSGQKRGRELFGKRSGYFPEKRRGRELFGKRSAPPVMSMEYDDSVEGRVDDEQRLLESLLARMNRDRRGKMSELLG